MGDGWVLPSVRIARRLAGRGVRLGEKSEVGLLTVGGLGGPRAFTRIKHPRAFRNRTSFYLHVFQVVSISRDFNAIVFPYPKGTK